ncbi:MAG: hypothetical protein Q7R76_00625 [Candidatus Woesearchaeota archaeon]|nr:hypothetical protein [Candidatus Woesearchaeota archaeon]
MLCVLLVTSVALVVELVPRSSTPIAPRSSNTLSELADYGVGVTSSPSVSAPPSLRLAKKTEPLSLSSYPSAFFKPDSHLLDGFIIVSPNASDTLRAAALDLNQKLVPTETAESDELEIGVDYVGGADGEWPGVSCHELTLLCIGSQLNLYDRYQYTETLFMPRGRVEYRLDPEDNDRVPRPYLFVKQENETYRYKITFLPALESVNRITATGGRLQSTTTPDTEVSLWGKEYILIDAHHLAQYSLALTLVGGIKDVLAEGQERTYDIDGEYVTIKPVFINANNTIFEINGQRMKPMVDDESSIIPAAHNRSIAVHEILENEGNEEDGLDRVEFYFGDNIELVDTNTTSPSRINELGEFVGSTVLWNNEQLPNVDVSIVTTRDDGIYDFAKVQVKSIELKYLASDDIYGSGKMSTQSEKIELGKKGNFLNLFELDYLGILPLKSVRDQQKTFEYLFHPRGKDAYRLKWQNMDGVWYDFDAVSCVDDACTNLSYGKKSGSSFYDLVVNESESIGENEYFFLKSETQSYFLTYDTLDALNNILTLREVNPDHQENERDPTYEVSYDATTGLGFFDLGKSTFTFNVTNETTGAVVADLNGDGDFLDTGITLRASSGGDFNFSASLEPRIAYQTNELYEDTRRDELDFRPFFDPVFKHLDVNVSDVSGTWLSGFNSSRTDVIINHTLEINKTDTSVGMTEFGMSAALTDADSQNQSTLTITAPYYQLFGFLNVYPTTFKKLVKRSDVISPLDKQKPGNRIVIGSPCENPATADIVGFGTTETECFLGAQQGEAVIRAYQLDTGFSALVVVGTDDAATINALEVLKEPEKYLTNTISDRVVVARKNGKIVVK